MAIDPTADQTAPIQMDGVPSSAEVRAALRGQGKPVLLAFSRGKDSLATWLALREDGVQVVPFHLYRVPGLRFVDESVKVYEDYFQTRIYQYPHPALFRWLNNMTFQVPERRRIIEAAQLPFFTYEELHEVIRHHHDLPGAWVADGVRASDSPNRRTALKMRGPWRKSVLKVSPIWDWRIRHVREAQQRHQAPIAVDYEWFGRSYDGLDYRFTEPLSRYAPDDYERLLEWFPLVDLEIFRAGLE